MVHFSIIITTYNRLPLLQRAVESALAQTVPCEVIVADDGSSDGTEAYVRSLGNRVVYHRNPLNLGHCATMNAGVSVACGDWIKPIDDDDYLAPNCIEEMVKAIAQYPQTVLCSCQAAQVKASGTEVSCTQSVGAGKAFYVLQEDIHYRMLLEQLPFGTPVQVAFRKNAFLQSGGWNTDFEVNYDDIDSWVKIAQYGDAVFVNQCLAYRTLWSEANHLKFSLQQRLHKNISIKNKIYALVHEKYRESLPSLKHIHAFLQLHWCLIGFKQRKFWEAATLLFPAIFDLKAWQLLISVIYSRKLKIPKIYQQSLPASTNLQGS
ncbi:MULTISPECIES: glycosyltransferase family 2 protein [unclassified Coleofasciculus]|uniref:glycosyltransferase family 2 protein n=1 Tax=unclassified Coleofasciculus TaxID=2692782 RepID=UPI00187E38F2|nr:MULTISPECIES: glycosyltransferase family 2 protein [unclassified Coleofasciculus]MBE9126520.1 glycosyltransferase family 2 protein [Coleofasciculus sp. LEGE 07081]MBE9149954.1 glycosyltransferase family 2 protein [Coleofasciculus sp. LEGE 07092]